MKWGWPVVCLLLTPRWTAGLVSGACDQCSATVCNYVDREVCEANGHLYQPVDKSPDVCRCCAHCQTLPTDSDSAKVNHLGTQPSLPWQAIYLAISLVRKQQEKTLKIAVLGA